MEKRLALIKYMESTYGKFPFIGDENVKEIKERVTHYRSYNRTKK
jgi:hypothetical protein